MWGGIVTLTSPFLGKRPPCGAIKPPRLSLRALGAPDLYSGSDVVLSVGRDGALSHNTQPQSDRVRRWEERCVSAVAYNPSFAGRQFVPSARAVAEERLLLPCMIWGHALGKAGPQSSLHFRISELPAPLPATRLQIPVIKQLRGWPVIASGQCHQQERPSFNPA